MGCDFELYDVDSDGEVDTDEEIDISGWSHNMIGRHNRFIYEGTYTVEELVERIRELTQDLLTIKKVEKLSELIEEYNNNYWGDYNEEEIDKVYDQILEIGEDMVDFTEDHTHISLKEKFYRFEMEGNVSKTVDVKEAIYAYSTALNHCEDKIFINYS